MSDVIKYGEIEKEKEFTREVMGGSKEHVHISAVISFVYREWFARGMFGAMEDAEQGESEVEIDSVDMSLIVTKDDGVQVEFSSDSTKSYVEMFGELEVEDVLDAI